MATTTLLLNNVKSVRTFLKELEGAPEENELKEIIGNDVAELVRDHLYKKDAEPNKLGGPKTHFYRSAGDSTSFEASNSGVVVFVSQIGIRQRLEGGVITPKKAKALTIPIRAEAHGKRAREFSNLFFIKGRKPNTAGVLARKQGGNVEALFVLRTRVEQKPDPTVLPKESVIVQTATDAITEFVQQVTFNN